MEMLIPLVFALYSKRKIFIFQFTGDEKLTLYITHNILNPHYTGSENLLVIHTYSSTALQEVIQEMSVISANNEFNHISCISDFPQAVIPFQNQAFI
jgi:hypothetical protein